MMQNIHEVLKVCLLYIIYVLCITISFSFNRNFIESVFLFGIRSSLFELPLIKPMQVKNPLIILY